MKVLHSMGYAQELERRMSAFSNFAVSFSIICILSGAINSLAQATAGAGGASIGIGWPLGCLISGVFALAMGQIASSYPTAGGLYHWSSILGNRFTGWLTAWLNLLGLVTVLGAINVGHLGLFRRRDRSLVSIDQCRYDRERGVPQSDPLRRSNYRHSGADQSLRHPADGEADGFLWLSHLRGDHRADTGVFRLRRALGYLATVDLRQFLGRPNPERGERTERRSHLAEQGQRPDGVPAEPVGADLHDHRL